MDLLDYRNKIVVSGEVVELYLYDKTLSKKINDLTEEEKTKKAKNEIVPQVYDENYKRSKSSAYRSRKELERLINANVGQYKESDKFITLTFSEERDRDGVIKCFKRFNERLRYKCKNDYKYIAVIERGTIGTERLHLHCIFFDLPFIKASELAKIWKYGFVKVNAIENYANISQYVTKYVEKTLTDSTYIPKGKKFYITSLGLKKPQTFYMDDLEMIEFVNRYEEIYPDKIAVSDLQCENEHVGTYRYVKIDKMKIKKTFSRDTFEIEC